MQLSESKTLENLKTAFANESAAMVRYEIFAEKAKQNGDEEISQVFRTTARNEKAHAQIWLGLIYGGIPEASDALEKAMHGENYEWTQMYKEYAETARQEGLDNIADLFEKVGDIEKEHESRFKLFVNKLTDGSLFTPAAKRCGCAGTADIYIAEVPLPNTALSAENRRDIFSERTTAFCLSLQKSKGAAVYAM